MTDVADFARFCGPGAYAAIAGISREDAAAELVNTADRLEEPLTPPGTPTIVLAHALVARGLSVERWSTRREPVISPIGPVLEQLWRDGNAIAALRSMKFEPPPPVDSERLAEIRRQARLSIERDRRRSIAPHTPQSWRNRIRVGAWMLFVTEPDHHVMAVRGGDYIAGYFPCYRDRPLIDVWRVRSPRASR